MKSSIMERDERYKMMEQLEQEIKDIEASDVYKAEASLKDNIDKVLKDHNKEPKDLLTIYPSLVQPTKEQAPMKPGGRTLPTKTYRNPHTGIEVTAKSTRHKTLQQWKKDYPDDDLDDWIVKL
tara:strand:+ start:1660 stop:2028 length:369 start_codon:yes stop_codon:yes gene_type:complete